MTKALNGDDRKDRFLDIFSRINEVSDQIPIEPNWYATKEPITALGKAFDALHTALGSWSIVAYMASKSEKADPSVMAQISLAQGDLIALDQVATSVLRKISWDLLRCLFPNSE